MTRRRQPDQNQPNDKDDDVQTRKTDGHHSDPDPPPWYQPESGQPGPREAPPDQGTGPRQKPGK
jgi:hypothetical protein